MYTLCSKGQHGTMALLNQHLDGITCSTTDRDANNCALYSKKVVGPTLTINALSLQSMH